jgi:hypothetical protein
LSDKIFISQKNSISLRWAIFEDDGYSGWLYLTLPDEEKPIADCWIYNRIEAPEPTEIKQFKNWPPPATSEYASSDSILSNPDETEFIFKWSKDGNSVALIFNNIPFGYIICNRKLGFSRNLIKSGPWVFEPIYTVKKLTELYDHKLLSILSNIKIGQDIRQ